MAPRIPDHVSRPGSRENEPESGRAPARGQDGHDEDETMGRAAAKLTGSATESAAARLADGATDHLVGMEGASAVITLRGVHAHCDPEGALWLPAHDTLVLSDLHFEKASHFARAGYLVPPYDTGRTLDAVEAAIARRRPALVVSLGDAFHDVGGPGRMAPADRTRLEALMAGRDWLWIRGNHDPALDDAMDGEEADALELGPLRLVHEPTQGPAPGEIAGHLHPVARLGRGRRPVRRPCFASDGDRLVMPAMGAFTGGLSVCAAPFRPILERRRMIAHMLGDGRVYSVPGTALC